MLNSSVAWPISDDFYSSHAVASCLSSNVGQGDHRRLVDRSRRRASHVAAILAEAAQDLEELQAQDLQRGPGQRQLHPDEERSEDIPLPTQVNISSLIRKCLNTLV